MDAPLLAEATQASFLTLTGALQNTSTSSSPVGPTSGGQQSEVGDGGRRVIAALRLFFRLQGRHLLDVLLADALLVGPFGFDRQLGGATVPQLCRFLGLTRKVVKAGLDAIKPFLCKSSQFQELEVEDLSEEESDADGGEQEGPSEDAVRYFFNFKAALPAVWCQLSKAFVRLIALSSGQLEGIYATAPDHLREGKPHVTPDSHMVYCWGCSAWGDCAHLRGGFICPSCRTSVLVGAASSARSVLEGLRRGAVKRRNDLSPQQLSLEGLYRDPISLQQLLLWNYTLSEPFVYTGLEREAVNPMAYLTSSEYAELTRHLRQAVGLIAPTAARAFQLRRSAQGNPPLKLEVETLAEREGRRQGIATSKLEKRTTLPPWMVTDPESHRAALGGKRVRDLEGHQAVAHPSSGGDTPYVPKFKHIARPLCGFNVSEL